MQSRLDSSSKQSASLDARTEGLLAEKNQLHSEVQQLRVELSSAQARVRELDVRGLVSFYLNESLDGVDSEGTIAIDGLHLLC